MNRNLVGTIYVRAIINIAHLKISSRYINKPGRHRQFLFLISQFIITFSSETARPNELKLSGKQLWMVLYKDYSVCLDSLTNMAATGNCRF